MIPDGRSTIDNALSDTGRLVPVPCPKCDGRLARRSHRDGLVEQLISLLYVYPFRCQQCSHRFFALQWGIRYHRVPVDHREYDNRLARIPMTLPDPDFAGKAARPGRSPVRQ